MIDYSPFWITLREKEETTYTLITNHHISSNTIDRIRKGKGITTQTINDLCRILDCKVQDIIEYLPHEDD